jgi:prepilin-type processing-associated H-X9-DG protein
VRASRLPQTTVRLNHKPKTMNSGLTRIDLIVAAFVALTSTALLLPGCEQSRIGARRAQCADNEVQLSRALLAFESQHGTFPGYRQPLANTDVGWGVMILPQIERSDLWEQWKKGKAAKALLNFTICPLDSPKNLGPEDGWSSYAVNTRICGDGEGLTAGYVASKDGKGNTLLLAENLRSMKPHTWWDSEPKVVGFSAGTLANNVQSNHGSGANVAFCDGHVLFLSEEFGDEVYNALVTPDGGEPIDASKL